MARTRGASAPIMHDESVATGKDGETLNMYPHGAPPPRAKMQPKPAAEPVRGVVHVDDGDIGPVPLAVPKASTPPVPPAFRYVCDRSSIRRDLDAYELLRILEHIGGPMVISASPEEFGSLPPDVRRHFRRVAVAPQAPE